MSLESPIKKDVDIARRDLEMLNRLYNVYFQGGEDDPPRMERKALDSLVSHIRIQATTTTNVTDRFLASSLYNRYQLMSTKWDKHLRGIENGNIPRPKKRK